MGQKTILVVDDDRGIVTLVSAMLKRADYHVLVAYNGEEALEEYRRSAPDLILLDLAMPGISGFEVLETIRREEAGSPRHTSIVLLTAHTQGYFMSRNLNVVIEGYITKPITAKRLLEELSHLLP